MTRLGAFMAWLFASVGLALLIVGLALVPASWSWADSGSCTDTCSAQCGNDLNCYTGCLQSCCTAQCGGDPTCTQQCLAAASSHPCGGTQGGGDTCVNGCTGQMPPDCSGGCNKYADCKCSCQGVGKNCGCF
jgi:hypothetical protein